MSDTEFGSHPLHVLDELRRREHSAMTLSFSRYLYRPQAPFDEREVFEVPLTEVNGSWLRSELSNLRPGWDLALNSSVVDVRRRRHHLPMIDFAKPSISAADFVLMRSLLGSGLVSGLSYFESGRSIHAYGSQLLGLGEWRVFMGKLLLLNLPAAEPLIDGRWVGHRLISGFAALRWSANSPHYLAVPKRIKILVAE